MVIWENEKCSLLDILQYEGNCVQPQNTSKKGFVLGQSIQSLNSSMNDKLS